MASLSACELAYLLDYESERYLFDEGRWVKIEVRQITPTAERRHGLCYSLTPMILKGKRLSGFDNAHGRSAPGGRYKAGPVTNGHWHRTESGPGRPYVFRSAFDLVSDFLAELERILGERGVSAMIIESERQADAGSEP